MHWRPVIFFPCLFLCLYYVPKTVVFSGISFFGINILLDMVYRAGVMALFLTIKRVIFFNPFP